MKDNPTKGFELFGEAFKPISYEPNYLEEFNERLQSGLEAFKKEDGELPQWERDAQEAAVALAEQAEEATRAMQKQADEAGAELEKQAATLPI